MFEALVKEFFNGVLDDEAKKLLKQLEGVGKDLASKKVAELAGRVIVKGVDEVVAAAVHVLDEAETGEFTDGYLDRIDEELAELVVAIKTYVPLQIDVEVNKKKFGNKSDEANAARKRREAGIAEVKQEVGDIFASAVGGSVKD